MTNIIHKHISQPNKSLSILIFCVFIVLITLTTMLASDMYIPSLPHITQYFSATPSSVKLTITTYFIGIVLSQLLYGALSDKHGRRPILLFGYGVFIVGTVIALIAQSISVLIIARLIQGAGIGAAMSLSRSICRDVFDGPRLSQVVSYVSMAIGIGPAIAPMIGGYLQHYFNWQANFYFMLGYAIIIILTILTFLPETNKNKNPNATTIKVLASHYKSLFKHPGFVGASISSSMSLGGIVAYYSLSPFILQTQLHITPIFFGWLTFFVAIFMLIGKGINAWMVSKLQPNSILLTGCSILALSGISQLILAATVPVSIETVVIPMLIFVIGTGLIFSNAFVVAQAQFRKIAGSATAVYSALQMLGTMLASYAAAHLVHNNQFGLGIMLAATGCISVLGYYLSQKETN